MKLKIGDKVKLKEDFGYIKKYQEGIIKEIYFYGEDNYYTVHFDINYDVNVREDYLILINNDKTTMNLTEKFLLALRPEPEKSFRKANITNGDDLLTEEGKTIFLSWLLEKNKVDFKTEVVDDLLKDEEKK